LWLHWSYSGSKAGQFVYFERQSASTGTALSVTSSSIFRIFPQILPWTVSVTKLSAPAYCKGDSGIQMELNQVNFSDNIVDKADPLGPYKT
jgi:hypothetical protein